MPMILTKCITTGHIILPSIPLTSNTMMMSIPNRSSFMNGIASAGGNTPAPTPDPAALIASGLKSVKGPVILAVVENRNALAVLGQLGANGRYRTWTTRDKQMLTFKSGVLVSTRGLGTDLMAADADQAIALVTGRRVGQALRTHYYLNGEGTTISVTLRCEISPGPSEALTLGALRISTRRMTESCSQGADRVENTYWVAGDGVIWQSRQWIGARTGYLVVQRLRR